MQGIDGIIKFQIDRELDKQEFELDNEAMNILWLPASAGKKIPLVQVITVFVEDLYTAVITIVDEHPPGRGVNGDTVDVTVEYCPCSRA